MDAIRMEIGLDLIPFVHREDPDNILTYIRRMRRDLASEFDITVPAVRVRDNIYLAARGYMIFLQEERVTEGSLQDREGATILADRLRQTILDHRGKLGN